MANETRVKIILEDGVDIPVYATDGSAGFDLKATKVLKLFKGSKEVNLDENLQNSISKGYIFLRPHERVLLGTGIKVELPPEKQLEVRNRSSVPLKRGLIVGNSPGTIDSDYRGEVGIIIINTTPFLAKIELGEAIAQGVITDYYKARFVEVDIFTDTIRGEGGFGSTNKERDRDGN